MSLFVFLVDKRYGEAFALGRINYVDGYCVTDARHLIHVSDARQMIELVCIFHSQRVGSDREVRESLQSEDQDSVQGLNERC